MARGAFPDSTRCASGMPGMHGNYTAVTAMQRSDLLIALGSRFDDRVTGKVDAFAPGGEGRPRRHRPGRARTRCGGPTSRSPATAGWSSRSCSRLSRHSACRTPTLPAACREARLRRPPRVRLRLTARSPRCPARATGSWRRSSASGRNSSRIHYDQQSEVGAIKPQFVVETLRDIHPRRHDRRGGGRPAPDVGVPVVAVRPSLHVGQLGRPRHDGLRRARLDRCQGRPARTARSGRSTATAASR